MRIPIREQLAGLILIASAIGLGVISIATWYTNHDFVLSIRWEIRPIMLQSLLTSHLVPLVFPSQPLSRHPNSRLASI